MGSREEHLLVASSSFQLPFQCSNSNLKRKDSVVVHKNRKFRMDGPPWFPCFKINGNLELEDEMKISDAMEGSPGFRGTCHLPHIRRVEAARLACPIWKELSRIWKSGHISPLLPGWDSAWAQVSALRSLRQNKCVVLDFAFWLPHYRDGETMEESLGFQQLPLQRNH